MPPSRDTAALVLPRRPKLDNVSNKNTGRVSAAVGSVIPLLGIAYFCALLVVYRRNKGIQQPINKKLGIHLHRYAPIVYSFIVFSSLVEAGLAIWLLVQWGLNDNSPNYSARAGTRFILFAALWASLTASTYTFLFLHPSWSRDPIASVGAQMIWILLTWVFWVSSTALLNSAFPELLAGDICFNLVYCAQIRTLFAFAVLIILVLTFGMLVVMWVAWQSTRSIRRT